MSIPTDFFPSNDEKYLKTDIDRLYKELSYGINRASDVKEFVDGGRNKLCVVKGATTTGSGTYTLQEGRYVRNLNLVDYWFSLQWTTHTGLGNLIVQLPFRGRPISPSGNGNFEGLVTPRVAVAMPAGTTALSLQVGNSSDAYIVAYGPGVRSLFPLASNIGFDGYIRYIAEDSR